METWGKLSEAMFLIGGEDQLRSFTERHPEKPTDEESIGRLDDDWKSLVSEIQARIGALFKTANVSILLGAGASKECGGVLMGSVPTVVERRLLEEGIAGTTRPRVSRWLRLFYVAVEREAGLSSSSAAPTREMILDRRNDVSRGDAEKLPVNYESLLSLMYRWRACLPETGGRLRLDGSPTIDVAADVLDECIGWTTRALVDECRLPRSDAHRVGLHAYRRFLRKLLARPLNLRRGSIFSLNYDTLVEQAADAEGVVLIDGFVGSASRVFRPESYDHDLYFPANTTEGRVHRLDRVLHLYKLHGSIDWVLDQPTESNPYGVTAENGSTRAGNTLIYPTPTKHGDSLGMPYAELMRRFASAVVQPQSTLFVIGYGFGDDHITAIVRQALSVPSFTLVIVDPAPQSAFVQQLKDLDDRRIWFLGGMTLGAFSGFVEHALPDLAYEDIRKRVVETQRALRGDPQFNGG